MGTVKPFIKCPDAKCPDGESCPRRFLPPVEPQKYYSHSPRPSWRGCGEIKRLTPDLTVGAEKFYLKALQYDVLGGAWNAGGTELTYRFSDGVRITLDLSDIQSLKKNKLSINEIYRRRQ